MATPTTANGVRPILVIILAPRGSGKSTLASVLVPWMGGGRQNVILIDPQGTLAIKLGVQRYNPPPTEEGIEEVLAPYLQAQERDGVGRCYVFDEFDTFCSREGYLGGRGGSLYKLINVARGWGAGTLAIARGSAQVAKNYLTNADFIFVGQNNEPNAVKYMRDLMGDYGGIEWDEVLRGIHPYDFLCWRPNSPQKFCGIWGVEGGELVLRTEEDYPEIASQSPPGTDGASAGTGPDGTPTDAGAAGSSSPPVNAVSSAPAAATSPTSSGTGSTRRSGGRA